MQRSLWIIPVLLVVSAAIVTPDADADTIYTYTGNLYTSCAGTYSSSGTTCAGSYALTVTFDTTLAGKQLNNLMAGTVTGGDLTAYVSSFTFADGSGLSITNLNTNPSNDFFDVTTDSTGDVEAWEMSASSTYGIDDPFIAAFTANTPFSPFFDEDETEIQTGLNPIEDYYTVNGGGSGPASGTWEIVPTPEPNTSILFGVGLLVLMLAMRKRIARGATGQLDRIHHRRAA